MLNTLDVLPVLSVLKKAGFDTHNEEFTDGVGPMVVAAVLIAMREEREACAKVCESEGRYRNDDEQGMAETCAFIIRARKSKENF